MTTTPPKTFAPLHLLRAAAATAVAIGHFGELGAVDLARTFSLCVPFFFILSGFVLEHAYGANIRSGAENLGSYAMRRFARLYPLHLLTMLAVIGFYLLIGVARTVVPISGTIALNASPVQWLESLTLTHFLFGGGVAFNVPSWSIAVEFWGSFYVFAMCLMPRGLVLLLALPITAAIFAAIEAGGGLLSGGRHIFVPIDKVYPIGSFCFTLGWLLRAYWQEISDALVWVPAVVWWTFTAIVFAALAADPMGRSFDWVYYPVFALMVAGMSTVTVSNKAVQATIIRVGDWSYGIYLWHIPVMLVARACIAVVESATGVDFTGNILMDATFVVVVFTIAGLTYPFERWAQKTILANMPSRLNPAN